MKFCHQEGIIVSCDGHPVFHVWLTAYVLWLTVLQSLTACFLVIDSVLDEIDSQFIVADSICVIIDRVSAVIGSKSDVIDSVCDAIWQSVWFAWQPWLWLTAYSMWLTACLMWLTACWPDWQCVWLLTDSLFIIIDRTNKIFNWKKNETNFSPGAPSWFRKSFAVFWFGSSTWKWRVALLWFKRRGEASVRGGNIRGSVETHAPVV